MLRSFSHILDKSRRGRQWQYTLSHYSKKLTTSANQGLYQKMMNIVLLPLADWLGLLYYLFSHFYYIDILVCYTFSAIFTLMVLAKARFEFLHGSSHALIF